MSLDHNETEKYIQLVRDQLPMDDEFHKITVSKMVYWVSLMSHPYLDIPDEVKSAEYNRAINIIYARGGHIRFINVLRHTLNFCLVRGKHYNNDGRIGITDHYKNKHHKRWKIKYNFCVCLLEELCGFI